MKRLLLIGVALGLIVIAGLGIAVHLLFDPERVRATIAAQASSALGMPVTLQAADVSIWPRARVTLSGLEVGQPVSLTLNSIEVATALGALLSRRIENAELTIADSAVDLPALLAALDGLARQERGSRTATTANVPLTLVSVDTIALRNVRVGFDGGAATLSLESALKGDRLDVRSFDVASSVTNLTATGAVESLSNRRAKLSISAESLDLDGMVALLSQAPKANQAGTRDAPFDVTLDVTAEKGRAGGVQFEKLKTTIHAVPGDVRMEPLGLGVFSGRVEGIARVDTSRPQPALTLETKVSAVDMSAVAAFAGHPGSISGRLAGELLVAGVGVDPAAALANATGRGAVSISDGVIPNLHLVREIVLAFGKPAPGSSGSGDRFTRLASTMQLTSNVVRLTNLTFASPDVDVTMNGTLNLSSGAMDMAGRAMLSEALTAQAGRDLVRYTADGNRVTVPVTVKGPISAPRVSVDTASLLRQAAENEFKSQIQKQTGGLLDRLKPKKP